MANTLCSAPLSSFNATPNPDNHFHRTRQNLVGKHNVVLNSPDARFCRFKAKAAKSDKDKDKDKKKSDKDKKPKSMICADCDGNGKVLCSQCQGSGVNSVDIFNGRFKKGDSCWICGGRKEMLCGNCNGAGFIGGFMSTFDE
ncbi:hypothetical protein TIFTF001_014609 [Ficus carica]|uniref:BSD2 cysteine rich domain-containing protein n=1 Tax=Ficus carica TaxID=3494 RepID=A0AA87ZZT4_FICCA|nr:hypothetical protein TIFTF001_014609 [Ficus carica]